MITRTAKSDLRSSRGIVWVLCFHRQGGFPRDLILDDCRCSQPVRCATIIRVSRSLFKNDAELAGQRYLSGSDAWNPTATDEVDRLIGA